MTPPIPVSARPDPAELIDSDWRNHTFTFSCVYVNPRTGPLPPISVTVGVERDGAEVDRIVLEDGTDLCTVFPASVWEAVAGILFKDFDLMFRVEDLIDDYPEHRHRYFGRDE